MTTQTLMPAHLGVPETAPPAGPGELTVSYAEFDRLQRAALAALAASAGGHPNPLGYLRDALGQLAPRPGAHPREYVPAEDGDAVWGRW